MNFQHRPTLVIRPEKLGDLVVATPAIRALKESFPESPLHVLTDDRFCDVLKHDPFVDKCLPVRWRSRDRRCRESLHSIYRRLATEKYARCAILYANWEPWNWLTALAGIPKVAQIGGTYSGIVFGHNIVRRKSYLERPTHYSEWYLQVAEALGALRKDTAPKVYVDPGEVSATLDRFPNFRDSPFKAILHLGASPEGDNYSVSALSRLAPRMAEILGTPVFVTGQASDRTDWVNLDPKNIHEDLLGNLSLPELMSVLSETNIAVMNSTGTIHLAAALDVRVVGLYGACPGNDSDTWGPLCRRRKILSPDSSSHICPSGEKLGKPVRLETVISEDKIISAITALRDEP